jgi:hypothetical protein
MTDVKFPDMRREVISALRSLADPEHQRLRWGRVEEGVDYYDDLTLNVHILYDDTQVLPSPETAVPAVLHQSEAPALQALDAVLGPLLDDLGEQPDSEFLADPRWPRVVEAARHALAVVEERAG